MSPPPGQVPDLVVRAAAGDRVAIAELLERYRSRLRRMVALRLDPRLQGRVDASDVIQEGYLDAMRRLDEFIRDPVGAVLHLAPVPGRPAGAGAAPAAPRHARPRRRPRGLDLPGRHARRQHRGPGGPAPGQADQPQPGGDAGRAEDPAPGGAQPDGPAGPRDPGPASLRADDQRRRRRGPGPGASRRRASATPGRWSGSRRSWPPCPGEMSEA